MKYVYILESIETPEHYYVGVTDDLRARLQKHNAGDVTHTSKFAPLAHQNVYRILRWRSRNRVREVSKIGVGPRVRESQALGECQRLKRTNTKILDM
jgi:GIY-YIG catalytic domain